MVVAVMVSMVAFLDSTVVNLALCRDRPGVLPAPASSPSAATEHRY